MGAVVLNRVKSPEFPNTIAGVIEDPYLDYFYKYPNNMPLTILLQFLFRAVYRVTGWTNLFVLGALLAGIGGILHSSRNFQTSVQMGIDLQLPAQICCLLGATYKTPGKYNVPGCIVGILLTTIITNGVYSTIGSSIYIKSLVEGFVFMTAIGLIATTRQEGLAS